MTEHVVKAAPNGAPQSKAPVRETPDPTQQQVAHPCDGVLKIECCCEPCVCPTEVNRLVSWHIPTGGNPGVVASATVQAWLNAGYLIRAVTLAENNDQGGYNVVMIVAWFV